MRRYDLIDACNKTIEFLQDALDYAILDEASARNTSFDEKVNNKFLKEINLCIKNLKKISSDYINEYDKTYL